MSNLYVLHQNVIRWGGGLNIICCTLYVTAAGLRAGILSLRPESVRPCYASGRYGDSVRHGDEYYFLLLLGGHALTSPEGSRPCLLGTFNYGVAGHLAFQLTQRKY